MNHSEIIDFPRKITLGTFSFHKGQLFKVLGHEITISELVYSEENDCWLVMCYAGEGANKTADFIWKYFKNGIMVEADLQEILC